jgi:hypothetical protein
VVFAAGTVVGVGSAFASGEAHAIEVPVYGEMTLTLAPSGSTIALVVSVSSVVLSTGRSELAVHQQEATVSIHG